MLLHIFSAKFSFANLNENPGKKYLYVYSVQLTILVLNLSAHICGHIAQISNHGRHLLHIFFHLLFPVIIGNPGDKTNLNLYAIPKNVQVLGIKSHLDDACSLLCYIIWVKWGSKSTKFSCNYLILAENLNHLSKGSTMKNLLYIEF